MREGPQPKILGRVSSAPRKRNKFPRVASTELKPKIVLGYVRHASYFTIMTHYTLLTLVAGNEVCNARCPFCISRMTPLRGVSKKKPQTDIRNLEKAASLARRGGANTVLITGKGEPTLFPEQISEYLELVAKHNFELCELQTNGMLIVEQPERFSEYLRRWYDLGLTTVSISITHWEERRNREIYAPHREKYFELPVLIDLLHQQHLTVRLACVLVSGYVDSGARLGKLIEFSRQNGVEQLSARPVNMPESSRDPEASAWVQTNCLSTAQLADIKQWVAQNGSLLQRFPHGAEIYDIGGQNVCLTNSLTLNPAQETIRQLIYFPDGTIAFDWQYEGAIILRGRYYKEKQREGRTRAEGSLHVLSSRSAVAGG